MHHGAEFILKARAITRAVVRLLLLAWIVWRILALGPEIASWLEGYAAVVRTLVVVHIPSALAIAALWFFHNPLINWVWPLPRPGCPECGYPIVPNAKVCPECGKPLSP